MKKIFTLRILLFVAFIIFFCFALYHYTGFSTRFDMLGYREPIFQSNEEYDPELLRLNTMDKLTAYCDSFYQANDSKRTYPGVVSEALRKRFYHGYSVYGLKDNFLGALIAESTVSGIRSIVISNDILKFPFAACSQQSIVGMEIFKKKGYKVRKVTLYDSTDMAGHFAFEVFFDGGWHFFDTNQEPDVNELRKYNRPSAAYLAENPSIILAAYRNRGNPEFFTKGFKNLKFGPVNEFPAPRAYLFQVVTKTLSNFGWLLIGILILLSYRIKKRQPKNEAITVKAEQKKAGQAAFSHN